MPSAETVIGGTWSPADWDLWFAASTDALAIGGEPATPEQVRERLAEASGAFALAWSDAQGRLHLARDPIGHRSLYWYRWPDGRVTWGSRIADLLARGVPRELDGAGLTAFLVTSFVPGTPTLVRGLHAVEPGVELVFDLRGPQARPFWQLSAAGPERSDEQLRRELRGVLEATVGRMLPGGPVAASLSGGIDSSLVVALARRAGAEVTALSVSFGEEHRNELAFSELVARHCGATHRVVEVRPDDILRGLDVAVGRMSEPNGDPLTVPNAALFRTAAELGLTVMLNGEGGDPCFGGPKNGPMLLAGLYGGGSLPAEYLRAHQRLYEDLGDLLEPGVGDAAAALEADVWRWLSDGRWPTLIDRLMALNVAWKGSGHILPKIEHLGLAAGVRGRSPLFDREVVEMAFRLPAACKRRGAVEKYLLKEAVRDLLPQAIVDRPKSGMLVPVEAWFDGPLHGWAAERLLDGLAGQGIVRRRWLEDLVGRRSNALRPRRGIKIWQLLTLEAWMRTVLRGP